MAESNIQNMFLSALGSVSTATAIGKHFKNQKQIIKSVTDTSADEELEAKQAGFESAKDQEQWQDVMYEKTGELEPDVVRKNLEDELNQAFAERKAFGNYQQSTDTKRNMAEALSVRERILREVSNRRPNWEEEVEAVKPKNQIKRGDK